LLRDLVKRSWAFRLGTLSIFFRSRDEDRDDNSEHVTAIGKDMLSQVRHACSAALLLAACSDPATTLPIVAAAGQGGAAGAGSGAGGSSQGGAGQGGSGSNVTSSGAGQGGSMAASAGAGGLAIAGSSGAGGVAGSSAGQAGAAGSGGAPTCPDAGHAVDFDGDARTQMDTDDSIGAVLPKGNASRTVEMWVYTVAKSWRAEHHLYQYGSANPREGAFGIDFGDGPYPNVQVYNNGSADTTFKVPQDSVKETGWFHFAMVWDAPSKTLRGVINGVTAGSKTITPMLTTPASKLSIGYSPTFSGSGGFTGKIDELRIWSVARSDAEIKSTMGQHLSGKETGLVVYYTFDEGTGTTAKDLVGGYEAKFGGNTQPKWATSEIQLTCP
jgi:Concanavalin A-like lectin/glucanases superfamily